MPGGGLLRTPAHNCSLILLSMDHGVSWTTESRSLRDLWVGSLRLPGPIGFNLFKRCIQILIGILKRARVRSTLALMFGRSSNGSVPRHVLASVGLPDLFFTGLHLRPPGPLSCRDLPPASCRHFALRSRRSLRGVFCPSRSLSGCHLAPGLWCNGLECVWEILMRTYFFPALTFAHLAR